MGVVVLDEIFLGHGDNLPITGVIAFERVNNALGRLGRMDFAPLLKFHSG